MLYTKEEINFEEWDDFVMKQGGTIFSTSTYLEACAKDWMVFWEKQHDFGIALPFTEKLGIKTLYQPFFSRYQEFLGQTYDLNHLLTLLKTHFQRSLMALRVDHVQENVKAYTHQVVESKDRKLSTNAKRQLKKFLKSNYTLTDTVDKDELVQLIHEELGKKLSVFSGNELIIFKQLVEQLALKKYLRCKGIMEADKLVGGLFYMEFGDRVIYLKGACKEKAKFNGGMYYLINLIIEESLASSKLFDFGGSRVQSVRNFNKKLGGVDRKYLAIHWDNSPFWFKLAQTIKKWIKK